MQDVRNCYFRAKFLSGQNALEQNFFRVIILEILVGGSGVEAMIPLTPHEIRGIKNVQLVLEIFFVR